MDLKTELEQTSSAVASILRDFFKDQKNSASHIHPHLERSVDFLEDFSLHGGKYIRSFLVKLGYQIAGGSKNDCLTVAAAIELHHKHILILDDIADRDESRYGVPTLEHRYYDVFGTSPDGKHRALSFAMLDGVFLGSLSRELLLSSSFESHVKEQCSHILNRIMYRDTLAGWQIHGIQAITPIEETTEAEFIQGLELVTASYTFEGPLRIGLTIAQNKDKKLEDALISYSKAVGTAFQIQDDILGLFGDPKVTGKPVGNDIREGKKTLLLQHAYAKANTDQKLFLSQVIGTALSDTELKKVQKIVEETGSLAHSKQLAKNFISEGIQALDLVTDCDQKELLTQLAHFILLRDK